MDPALLAASAPVQYAGEGASHAAVARALVDAGATTKPAAVVASILSAHAAGTALNRIAAVAGMQEGELSALLAAEAEGADYRPSLRQS